MDKKFGKKEHLKSRKQIDALFSGGQSFFIHPVKVFWQIDKSDSPDMDKKPVQVGVTASKRNFKHAVDRNRVKRLLREAYRLNKQLFLPVAETNGLQVSVFFIFVDKTLPTFELVDNKMKACLKKLAKTIAGDKNEKLL